MTDVSGVLDPAFRTAPKDEKERGLPALKKGYTYDEIMEGARIYLGLKAGASHAQIFRAGYKKYHPHVQQYDDRENEASLCRLGYQPLPYEVFRWAMYQLWGC